ncbi:hypothetical protein CPK_ORF00987 [Chlamydia pneumoniae LPCoLN]|uniref:FlxA-like family protein n=1 Tax=Chlamydia pneumoniae TaxID=83558 RepID=UPI0001BD9B7E|nr:FlxA-like family protein [Chlamydia pneumoniae]ACZ33449.1 hypothetical protein CPK_ORF00987 [Chlamydia pneumoniae LPCoLN]ETR80369.1 hypothetical protein X556_0309 [Chlamydia pneumoniae B21]
MASGIGGSSGLGKIPPKDNGDRSRSPSPKGELGSHEISLPPQEHGEEGASGSSHIHSSSSFLPEDQESQSSSSAASSPGFFSRVRSGVDRALKSFGNFFSAESTSQARETRQAFVRLSKTITADERQDVDSSSAAATEARVAEDASVSGENPSQGVPETSSGPEPQRLFSLPSVKKQSGLGRLVQTVRDRIVLPSGAPPPDSEPLSLYELNLRLSSLRQELSDIQSNDQLTPEEKAEATVTIQQLIQITEFQCGYMEATQSSVSLAEARFEGVETSDEINSLCSELTDPELQELMSDGDSLQNLLDETADDLEAALSHVRVSFSLDDNPTPIDNNPTPISQEEPIYEEIGGAADPQRTRENWSTRLWNQIREALVSLLGMILSILGSILHRLRIARHAAAEAVGRCCTCRGEECTSSEGDSMSVGSPSEIDETERTGSPHDVPRRDGSPREDSPLMNALVGWARKHGAKTKESSESSTPEISISAPIVRGWSQDSSVSFIVMEDDHIIYDVPRRKDGIYDVPSSPRWSPARELEEDVFGDDEVPTTSVEPSKDENIYMTPRLATPAIYDLPSRPGSSGSSRSPSSDRVRSSSPNRRGVPLPPVPSPAMSEEGSIYEDMSGASGAGESDYEDMSRSPSPRGDLDEPIYANTPEDNPFTQRNIDRILQERSGGASASPVEPIYDEIPWIHGRPPATLPRPEHTLTNVSLRVSPGFGPEVRAALLSESVSATMVGAENAVAPTEPGHGESEYLEPLGELVATTKILLQKGWPSGESNA